MPRAWLVVGALLIVGVVLLQRRGQLVHDTRFDLLLDPRRFLADAWDFWFSREDFGRVQNQRAGYFFPMGPFLAVGDVLGLAPWITERLWMAVLLVAAWWGTARLADELRLGTPPTRVLGAAAYALSPFFMGRTGAISAFVQGGALLPWIMVPLVRASRTGSPRRGACRSAVAVALIGGANAAVTVSMLVVPVLWLLTRAPGPRRRAIVGWWSAAVVAAMTWWIIPLALQSRYGTDFFPISEQADVTTLVTGPFDVVRGAADWVGHLDFFGDPHFLGASVVTTSEIVIIGSGLLAAAGLVGLVTRSIPEARFLRLTLLVGMAIIGGAHGGLLGNPASDLVLDLLESGPLAAFRTVYKFQPIVLLPLALGIAHVATKAPRIRRSQLTRFTGIGVIALLALMIVLSAKPLLSQEFVGSADDAFDEVPSWWVDAGRHLDQTDGRALLVPGLPKSISTWGLTDDEPLAWLTNQPWATRNQVPFGTYDSTRYLDVVEATIATGGDPGLPAILERAGITEVLLRNDARWQQVQVPSPRDVNDALTASGLSIAASYGPVLAPEETSGASDLHAIEIYEVPGADERRARFYPAASAAVVSGDSSSLLALHRWGLTDRALVFANDLQDGQPIPPTWIVTDGNQRRTTSFGKTRDNLGYVLGHDDRDPNERTAADARFYPDDELRDQTVSTYGDIESVSASSYGSLLTPVPSVAPTKVLDGDERTSWMPTSESPEGEWIEFELDRPRRLGDVEVATRKRIPPTGGTMTVRATTDRGSRSTTLDLRTAAPQAIAMPAGPTGKLRLTIDNVSGPKAGVGIREVLFPTLDVEHRLLVPDQLRATFRQGDRKLPIYVFSRTRSDELATQPFDRESVLRRRFTLPRGGALDVEADALAQPSPEVLAVLGTTPTMTVAASTTAGDLPRYAPRNLVDGDAGTYWAAEYPDRNGPLRETISLAWSEPRTLDRLTLAGVPGHRFPDRIRISNDDEVRDAAVDENGLATFAPLVADDVTIELVSTSDRIIGTSPVLALTNPFALTEVDVPAVEDLMPGPVDYDEPVDVGCDAELSVQVGDEVRTFSVQATLGDLAFTRPVDATPCDAAPVALPAGRHDLDARSSGSPFTIESVLLGDPSAPRPPPQSNRSVVIDEWDPSSRTLTLDGRGAGYLNVTQNYNEGWSASISDRELDSIILDGWQQGFVVPAGVQGTVTLEFEPNRAYRIGLVLGACLVLLVGLGALLRSKRSESPALDERPWSRPWAWAIAGILTVAIAGIGALLLIPLALLARRRRAAFATIAGTTVAVATIVVASSPESSGLWGSEGDLVTLLVVSAVAVVATALATDSTSGGPPSPAPEE